MWLTHPVCIRIFLVIVRIQGGLAFDEEVSTNCTEGTILSVIMSGYEGLRWLIYKSLLTFMVIT